MIHASKQMKKLWKSFTVYFNKKGKHILNGILITGFILHSYNYILDLNLASHDENAVVAQGIFNHRLQLTQAFGEKAYVLKNKVRDITLAIDRKKPFNAKECQWLRAKYQPEKAENDLLNNIAAFRYFFNEQSITSTQELIRFVDINLATCFYNRSNTNTYLDKKIHQIQALLWLQTYPGYMIKGANGVHLHLNNIMKIDRGF